MARPTKLTPARHARIVELLRDGVPFATACRQVGVSSSAGYEWLYRGWGTHPDRPPATRYVAFAQAVDAVFPGGFAERHDDEDEFAEPQKRTENGREASGTSRHVQAHDEFVDVQRSEGTASAESPQNRSETGDAPHQWPPNATNHAEFAEAAQPTKSDTQRDRARAREKDGDTEPRHAPMPWLSQRSRGEISILDIEF
jgi:hypothetical protein